MMKIENNPTFQHFYHTSVDLARAGLRKACQMPDSSDTELIRAALARLPQDGKITRYRDLVNLRWATILLEHIPENHPERRALHPAWYQAMSRAKDVI